MNHEPTTLYFKPIVYKSINSIECYLYQLYFLVHIDFSYSSKCMIARVSVICSRPTENTKLKSRIIKTQFFNNTNYQYREKCTRPCLNFEPATTQMFYNAVLPSRRTKKAVKYNILVVNTFKKVLIVLIQPLFSRCSLQYFLT